MLTPFTAYGITVNKKPYQLFFFFEKKVITFQVASFRFVADGGSNRIYDAFKHDHTILEQ